MTRRNLSRLVLVGILASCLAFAGPAQAQAAKLANPVHVWDWFDSLWEKGISALWSWSEAPTAGGEATPGAQGGVAPNGGTTPGDEGPGIDPNGG